MCVWYLYEMLDMEGLCGGYLYEKLDMEGCVCMVFV